MKPNEREFLERLNEIDRETSMIPAYCACAISGAIVGIIGTILFYEFVSPLFG